MAPITPHHALSELLTPELGAMLAEGRMDETKATLLELMIPELADVLASLPDEQRSLAVSVLPPRRVGRTIMRLEADQRESLLKDLPNDKLASVLNEMNPDDRTELLEELPDELLERSMTLLRPDERRVTEFNLAYPEESVGRLMTSDFVAIRPDWTVAQTIEHIRKHGRDAETIDTLYVVDDEGMLLDDIRIRQLILSAPTQSIASLMDQTAVSLKAGDDREEAVRVMNRYDRPVLPVTDAGRLVGIITFDDVADVAAEETTEDIQKMGGMEALDEPYMSVSLIQLFRKRGIWLSVLFIGEMLTATAMAYFQVEIEHAAVLAIFLPLIISSGGNSGSQASTLIIRAMATREVRLGDWFKVFRRELACGLLLGVLLGLIGLLRIHAWEWLGWGNYTSYYHLVALAVSISLIGVVLWGTIMGAMLPFLLRAMRLDPATISAPFIATFVDVSGLTIYFTIALVILRGTLL
ncbi:MAG: Magnesium transporter MgtE [Phycisphaerae bacterium]|nr:Magnesium transporter MgtE [Phycisphaerae bacterium]